MSVLVGFYYVVSSLVLKIKYKQICEIIDFLIYFLVLLYVAFVYKEKDKDQKYIHTSQADIKNFKELEESKIEKNDQEIQNSTEIFQIFQILLIFFSFYIGIVLTDWDQSQSKYLEQVAGVFQGVSVALFYVWSLIAPLIFPDREFSRF